MSLLALSTSAQQLVPQNRLRKSIVFQNQDSSINIFIKRERPGGLSVTSSDFDHRIGPGSSIALSLLEDGLDAVSERYTGIAASGTPNLAVLENEDITR